MDQSGATSIGILSYLTESSFNLTLLTFIVSNLFSTEFSDNGVSIMSIKKQVWLSSGCLVSLKILKVTCSSWTLRINFSYWTSIKAPPVAKKGLPKIRGTS